MEVARRGSLDGFLALIVPECQKFSVHLGIMTGTCLVNLLVWILPTRVLPGSRLNPLRLSTCLISSATLSNARSLLPPNVECLGR